MNFIRSLWHRGENQSACNPFTTNSHTSSINIKFEQALCADYNQSSVKSPFSSHGDDSLTKFLIGEVGLNEAQNCSCLKHFYKAKCLHRTSSLQDFLYPHFNGNDKSQEIPKLRKTNSSPILNSLTFAKENHNLIPPFELSDTQSNLLIKSEKTFISGDPQVNLPSDLQSHTRFDVSNKNPELINQSYSEEPIFRSSTLNIGTNQKKKKSRRRHKTQKPIKSQSEKEICQNSLSNSISICSEGPLDSSDSLAVHNSESLEIRKSAIQTTKDFDENLSQSFHPDSYKLICYPKVPDAFLNPDLISKEKRNSVVSISCESEEFEALQEETKELILCLQEDIDFLDQNTMNELDTSESSDKLSCLNLDPQSLKCVQRINDKAAVENKNSMPVQMSDSEAGPEIATGLTSSDLRCASEFFKQATEIENQIRNNCALSTTESSPTSPKDNPSSSQGLDNLDSKNISVPPHEERSAPEGTSSPDPRPRSAEESQHNLSTPKSPSCSSCDEVSGLLKKQAVEFEGKLLHQGIVSTEKYKEIQDALKQEQKHNKELTASKDALLKLVEQYKAMFSAVMSQKDKGSKELEQRVKTLEEERKQAIDDLNNVENAFSDVHRKYERAKKVIDTYKRSENTYKNTIEDYEEKLQMQETHFLELQTESDQKIAQANEELESMNRTTDQEIMKMSALLKKAEMKIVSLQDALERKVKENQELSHLCDELIQKVGS